MNKKFNVLIALYLSLTGFCFAQDGVENIFSSYYLDPYNSNVIPQTPTSSNFTIYGDTPVNTSSGLVNISIPIYTLVEDGVSVPITLSYHASGVKVDDISSTVGLKWSLNAGGGIYRTINDNDDFGEGVQFGWIRDDNSNVSRFTQFIQNVNPNYLDRNDQEMLRTEIARLDLFPDDFNYNFLNFSGEFIFQPNGEIFHGKKDNLIIYSAGTVADQQGNYYNFGTREDNFTTTISYNNNSELNSIDRHEEFGVGWMLDNILTKNSKNIYFEYISYNDFEYEIGPASQRLVKHLGCSYCDFYPYGCEGAGSTAFYQETLKETKVRYNPQNKLISKIYSENVEISFIYVDGPVNINGSNVTVSGWDKRIDKIIIKDQLSELTKEYQFVYGVFNGDKRLKLTQVYEIGFDEGEKPAYQFFYNEENPLPVVGSKAKDFRGFYNGKLNNQSLLPKTQTTINNNFVNTFYYKRLADRSYNFDYAKTGSLKEIIYPTGGKTEFKYELNAFGENTHEPKLNNQSLLLTNDFNEIYDLPPYTNSSGYAYSKLVEINDFIQGDILVNLGGSSSCPECGCGCIEQPMIVVREYFGNINDDPIQYNSIGDIVSQSQLSYNEEFISLEPGLYIFMLKVGGTESNYNPSTDLIHVNFSWHELEADNNNIVYQQNYFGGLKIKEVRDFNEYNEVFNHKKYTYLDCYLDSGSSTVYNSADNFRGLAGQYIFSSEYIPIHNIPQIKGYVYTNVQIENIGEGNNGKIIETYEPDIVFNKIKGGQLKEKEVFDNTNQHLSITSYDYHTNFEEYSFMVPSEVDQEFVELMGCMAGGSPFFKLKPTAGFKSHPPTSVYFQKTEYPINKKSTQFLKSGSNFHPVTTISDYDYNDDFLVTYEKTDTRYTRTVDGSGNVNYSQTNPNGEYVEVEYTYKSDYPGEPSLINLPIALPISKEVKNKGQKILGQFFEYYPNGNIKATYQYNKGQGTNNSPLTYIPPDYEKMSSFVFVEDKVVQVLQQNGRPISYVYGYNHQFPVAKVENATYTQALATGVSLTVLNNPVSTEAQIVTELNKIRTNLPNAMVTTYTYAPLKGVTSITDPKGDKIFYDYDGFGRLVEIKDAQGNYLEEYDYNYKQD